MGDPRPIGYWLRVVDTLINEQFSHTLDEHGVTRVQWQLLNVLAGGGSSVEQLDVALRPFLVADGSETAIDHVTELIESGWVDATSAGYELTERGHGARDRLTNVISGQRTDMTAGVAEGDYVAAITTLEQIARNLGWSDEA